MDLFALACWHPRWACLAGAPCRSCWLLLTAAPFLYLPHSSTVTQTVCEGARQWFGWMFSSCCVSPEATCSAQRSPRPAENPEDQSGPQTLVKPKQSQIKRLISKRSRRVSVSCCGVNDLIHSQQSSFPEPELRPSAMLLCFLSSPAAAAAGTDPSGELAATTQRVPVQANKQRVLTNTIRVAVVQQQRATER